MIGQSIAHFQVTAKLGEGGMGEVYRARDSRLNREVALKVLPEIFAADRDRMARFSREAQVLASLNHPHVATLFGLEEVDGRRVLVMELVEGPTLADCISQGPIPLDEALPIALHIAEALEYAHERGIIHRDLKPANIKLTAEGKVKVLDFGLAKALTSDASAGEDLANSPTLSVAATRAGVILGTAAYMSPEQARGAQADKRADIWAFGCVLHEMLAGKRLFDEATANDTLAAVLRGELNFAALPAGTPRTIRRLLERCLERDRKRRLRDIGEARISIEDALAAPGADAESVTPAPQAAAPALPRVLPWALAGVLAIVAVWMVTRPMFQGPSPASGPVRFSLMLAAGDQFTAIEDSNTVLAISPDGTRMVYTARSGGTAQMFLRRMDRMEAMPLPGTETPSNPFFSPDGKWVAFTAAGKLKKVSVDGGSPLGIAHSSWGGGAWGAGGDIIFTPSYALGLWRVPAAGGEPEKLTEPDRSIGELGHWWPQYLPGEEAVLYTSWITPVERARLVVLSLKTGRQKVIYEGGAFGHFLPTGHLVFMRNEGLMAVPFDLRRLEVRGAPVRVMEDVRLDRQDGYSNLAFSSTGTLVYMPKDTLEHPNEAVWVDRLGNVQPIPLPPGRYEYPRLSPDGRLLALTLVEQDAQDVWVYDLDRGTRTRVATGPTSEFNAHWTRDGRRLIYNLERTFFDIFARNADGTGDPEPVYSSPFDKLPSSISADGKLLFYVESHPDTQYDIWALPLETGAKPYAVLNTPFNEQRPAVSPDGRWLAYQSDFSGRIDVYVQSFPELGERFQVSIEGGFDPMWSRDGNEIYFRRSNQMMAVRVKTSGGFSAEKPVSLFRGDYDVVFASGNYDVTSDGRFLMLRTPPDSAPRTLVFVLNWFEELKRLVPIDAR